MYLKYGELNTKKTHKKILLKILEKLNEDDIKGIFYEEDDEKIKIATLTIRLNPEGFNSNLEKIFF